MKTRKHQIPIIGLLLVLGIAGFAVNASAQIKPNVFDDGNRWLITYFNDCDPAHTQWATQGICFLPYERCSSCGITGAWYSDTFPDWNGRYMQEGDRILMHGDYAANVGHDGMVIELFAGTSPADEGAGQWTEWREVPGAFGTTIGFGNTRLRRVGRCPLPAGVNLARMSAQEIDRLAADLSAKVKPRLRRDGKAAESPNDREQVPLPEEKQYQRP
jgi:hypothetical protein